VRQNEVSLSPVNGGIGKGGLVPAFNFDAVQLGRGLGLVHLCPERQTHSLVMVIVGDAGRYFLGFYQ